MEYAAYYKKGIVAIVGIGLLLLNRHLGVDLTGMEPAIVDGIVGVLTAVGVIAVSNGEKPAP